MTSIVGILVLLLAILTLGGCGSLPYGYGDASGGYGYGGSYPQVGMPLPMPMDQGYATGYAAPAGVYAPQPYVYGYAEGATVYAPGAPNASPGIDRREREQAQRIRQGLRDGSLTPQEARRLWAEQRRIHGAEARMNADGRLSPQERGRLNAMQNQANRDIYRARHNGAVQSGAPGPMAQPNHGRPVTQPHLGPMARPQGPAGPMMAQGPRMQAPMQAQMRQMRPSVAQPRPAAAQPRRPARAVQR